MLAEVDQRLLTFCQSSYPWSHNLTSHVPFQWGLNFYLRLQTILYYKIGKNLLGTYDLFDNK
jgi:hypothetical protein